MARSGMTDQDRYENLLAEISGRSGASAELSRDAATHVLCVLGERISSGVMEALMADLPSRLAERVRECEGPVHEAGSFGKPEFFRRVEQRLGPVNPEAIVQAVFESLLEQLPEQTAAKVSDQLPPELRVYWHAPKIMETVDRYGVFMADLAAIGAERADQVVCYCGGGISATEALFLLHRLGHARLALYDASMAEWARDESLPIERG